MPPPARRWGISACEGAALGRTWDTLWTRRAGAVEARPVAELDWKDVRGDPADTARRGRRQEAQRHAEPFSGRPRLPRGGLPSAARGSRPPDREGPPGGARPARAQSVDGTARRRARGPPGR